MGQLFQDLRYAVRMLLIDPGLTVVIVLSLAIGIGANSAVFSVVDTQAWPLFHGTVRQQRQDRGFLLGFNPLRLENPLFSPFFTPLPDPQGLGRQFQ